MKKFLLLLVLLASCKSADPFLKDNYRMIDVILHNPDTLKVLGRDTIQFPNPEYKDKIKEYSDYSINWLRPRAECCLKNGYKIVKEMYWTVEQNEIIKGTKYHKIELRCKNSDYKMLFVFIYEPQKKFWKFFELSPLSIGETPNEIQD